MDEEVIGLAAVVMIFMIPIMWIVFHYIFAMTRTVMHAGLKREMIIRGYSAQEIIEVVAAHPGRRKRNEDPWHGVPPAKPVPQPAHQQN